MTKYAIWDKVSPVYTPNGKKFTAEEWKEEYPIAELESVKIVCGGGELNGAFFGVFSAMVDMYRKAGCDFSACESDQDYLDAIEAFEDEMNKPSGEPTPEERQAQALEAIANGATSETTAAMEALLTGEEV